jgi:formylglycine-generating enzyme required for sulfatase activity
LWGLREKMLAGHLIVLPATLEGLAELAESFELPGTSDFPRWDQSSIGPPPPDTERSVTITQLRDYLGEETFQWLCACAVYPELQWDLTLYLGSLPCMGKGLISARYLLRLIRLSWFRAGSIPDEMRLQLIGELDPAREREIRSAIIQMLEKNPAPQGTYAADAQRLDIAAQKAWIERDDRKKLQQAVDEIKSLPQEDLTRDYTLVRFLESVPGSRLAMLLPRRLRKLFFEGGVPGYGLKTGVRALASGLLMIAVWFGATALLLVGDSGSENVVLIPGPDPVSGNVILIPEGRFEMGRDLSEAEKNYQIEESGRRINIFTFDYPAHDVLIKSFYLDRTEVSNSQYSEFVRATAHRPPDHWNGREPPPSADDLPVTYVTYQDASDYCSWRTQPGKNGLRYRLPTEAEWEYAARGANAGQINMNLFPWGNEWIPGRANTRESRLEHTQNVDSNETGASPFGALNLAGNVFEWTATEFSRYPGSDRATPREPNYQGSYQVIRGGSFDFPKEYAMTTTRTWVRPTNKGDRLGFRCAADSEQLRPQAVANTSPSPAFPSPTPTQAPAAPQIAITPRSLNFGNLEALVGQVAPNSVQRRLQIRNAGSAPLRISNITLTSKPGTRNDSFTIASRACFNATLTPGQSCSIAINFVTRATGRFSATLIINSNAADSPHQVTLSGNGVEPGLPGSYDVNPDSLNFGEQQLRTRSNPRTVTLTNRGKSTISVVAVSVSSMGPSVSKASFDDKQAKGLIRVVDFAISRDNCTKRTLNPGSSCTVGVVFIPQSLTTIRGTLTINLRGISARVALRGVGVSRRQTTN